MDQATGIAALDGTDTSAPLKERILLLLKGMIADGLIRPGERLMEAEVVRAFGISRSPAREALRRLCEDGLVSTLPGRGYRVAGAARADDEGRPAVLDPMKLSAPRQWERMYKEVEQELFVRTLFGTVRINEVRLAEHFGVSRTVTRDLLARMHGVGLVAKDDSGHWVAQKVTPDRIRHLYEMRTLLEPAALLQAAPHASADMLEAMRARTVAARRQSPIDSAAFDQAESDLHLDLLGLCPNDEILRALGRTHLLFGPTRYLFDPFLGIPMELIEAALREHEGILEHLLDKHPEAAAARLRSHLKDAVDRWLKRFEISARLTPQDLPPYLAPI